MAIQQQLQSLSSSPFAATERRLNRSIDENQNGNGSCPQRLQQYNDDSDTKYATASSSPMSREDVPLETPFLAINSTEDELEEIRRLQRRENRPWFGEGSIKSSIFNLTNATLGAGIVSVPFAMMSLGMGFGVLTMTLLAIASTTATKALVNVLDYTATNDFGSLAFLAGGRHFSSFVQLILFLFNFGSAVGYLICMADIFTVVTAAYNVESLLPPSLHFMLSRTVFLCFITLLVLLPLCLVNKLSKLRMVSLIGLTALELLVIVTFVLVFQKGVHSSLGAFPYDKSIFPRGKDSLRGIPLLVFAFTCHSNAPSIYAELEFQSYRRMAKVARRSVITAFITYLVMGIAGFLIFGYTVSSNILTSFTADLRNSTLLLVAFTGILLGVMLSYPMNIFPCRSSLETLLFPNNHVPNQTQITLIVIGLLSVNLFAALVIPSLALLFSLSGSICGACVAFIFPGIFVLQLLPYSWKDHRMIKALILLIVGVFIAIFGTAVSVGEIIREPKLVVPVMNH